MSKLASISQVLSKFCHFLDFSSFYLSVVDRQIFYGFYKELEPIGIISVKKVLFLVEYIWAINEAKIDRKCLPYIIHIWCQ